MYIQLSKISFLRRFIIPCAIAVLLTGCGAPPQTKPAPSAEQTAETETAALTGGDAECTLADVSKIKVKEFNLGEGELKTLKGFPVPCPLNGIIAVPEGTGPFPLVIIFQGVYAINDVYKDKICEGYDYLVKQLAAQGYVAMSFNINVEYTFDYGESVDYGWAYEIYKQHLAKIESSSAGEDAGYGVDLEGKVDTGDLHLMGHSRGGQIAEVIARREKSEGKNRIHSLFCIAPPPMGIFAEPLPDVPTGVVISEFDEDVAGSGQKIFDEIQKTPGRKCPAAIVYLRGANHAFFCRSFARGDDDRADRLTRERQEDFTARYISQFLDVFSKGGAPSGLFDTSVPQPRRMYGYDVVASYCPPGKVSLLSVTEGNGQVTAKGAELRYVVQTINGKTLFRHPGYPEELPLYNIRWTDRAGAVSVAPETADFTPYRALSVYLAVDSSDRLNAPGEPQALTVALKTRSGAERSVVVPKGIAALSYHPGEKASVKEFDGSVTEYWTGQMPLGDLRIPLSFFNAIDLGEVSEISLSLDQTDSGAIMISGMYLTP
ncbi:MAG: dienelactone hydrolase family protein [Gracilibacteraceae bacterium]|jgi:dienelactone hydrolase|nr:dienelactone hydrolase family protein [Gracilibacteraceae bacterium]